MSVAHKFMRELQEGNINEAIETVKSGLRDRAMSEVNSTRNEVLESYGFAAKEEQKESEEE